MYEVGLLYLENVPLIIVINAIDLSPALIEIFVILDITRQEERIWTALK